MTRLGQHSKLEAGTYLDRGYLGHIQSLLNKDNMVYFCLGSILRKIVSIQVIFMFSFLPQLSENLHPDL